MNLGSLIVLLKLFEGGKVSPAVVGPPTPEQDKNPQNVDLKPTCGPGYYAYKDPLSKKWSCLVIPNGR